METLEYIHSRILGIGPANNDQSRNTAFSITVSAYRCACNHWSQVHLSEEPGDNCLTSGQGSYKMDQGSVAFTGATPNATNLLD